MEETTKKFPSLPPNYVSLQQLQEQRLREQKEKEEEEQRLKEEKEEKEKQQQQQQQKEEEEKKKKKLLFSQKAPRIKSYDQTSIRNGRNFSQKSWLIKEKNEAVVVVVQNPDQKVEEVEPKRQQKKRNKHKKNGASEIQKGEAEINVGVEAEEFPDLDHQNLKEIETKKKKQKKKYKGKKPMVEEETLIEDMKESLPPAMIPNENDAGVKKNTRTVLRRRDTKPPPPESDQTTTEIVEKIGDLRIGDDDEKKSTVEKKKKKNGDYSRVTRFRKIINGRKRMDGNLMWIRKDEKTDGIPVGSGYIAGKF